ncbi:pyridoxamine 5'-phosphate oxidase family protein [Pseudooceanicola sp. CBS1P-1]|uniref:Pyridoxamine 5'-phosphate oxidase family protein n=1 Tax=Pseudooceanicola albus TaxID=2692189 RepID=A0A6L7G020_9RHOB|nr:MULTISPECIES: MSMEG_1061 family FMN-dependent PPOX-type flavoprotein [Pseudooceanicola]MBT9382328.1 pyridoxamine 5'-phosphate oxidase family protein [Pseudooceanicola endophyticus]MXN16870.1 pyridoxamine 5'-phosphate oxidase family protein [Pseudooceanicola albus]
MTFTPKSPVTSRAALRAILPEPTSVRVLHKDMSRLNALARDFIALSPFAVLSTRGADGSIATSPRGDAAGFVRVADDHTLLLPDRLGNQRLDSFENILRHPEVGLLFLIPGHTETLRVSGRAQILRDEDIRAALAHNGRLPDLALAITVERVFMHCSKAFVRSALWRSETWPARRSAPTLAQWAAEAAPSELNLTQIQEMHDEDARTRLY